MAYQAKPLFVVLASYTGSGSTPGCCASTIQLSDYGLGQWQRTAHILGLLHTCVQKETWEKLLALASDCPTLAVVAVWEMNRCMEGPSASLSLTLPFQQK